MASEERKPLGCGGGCLGLIAIFVGAFVFLYLTSSYAPLTPVKRSCLDEKALAYSNSNRAVLAALKAPATAIFPGWADRKILNLGKGKYIVRSYVDSQNGFGAMIRSKWAVTIQCVEAGEDLEWIPTKIDID